MTEQTDYLSRVFDGGWLDSQQFPPMSWAVHGLIPEGMGLMTGAPKAGKSWAALGIALAVASGGMALGKVPTGDPRPVLLLALEDGPRRLQGRCRTLAPGQPIPQLLHFVTAAGPADVLQLVGAWLDRYGDHRPLAILDTLGKVMPPALPGEGAYQRDYRVGSRLKALTDEHPGACLLVVHHTRKAGSEDWMDSTSGTNGLNGAADFTINLSRNRNEDTGVIRVTGRDVPEGEYAVTNVSGSWVLDGEALADAARKAAEVRATANLGDRATEVLRLVNQHPEGIGPTEVGRQLDMPASNAGTYLQRLEESGRIRKHTRGRYAPLASSSVESVESVETAGQSGSQASTLPIEKCGNGPEDFHVSTLSTPVLQDTDFHISTLSTRRCALCSSPDVLPGRGICPDCDQTVRSTA